MQWNRLSLAVLMIFSFSDFSYQQIYAQEEEELEELPLTPEGEIDWVALGIDPAELEELEEELTEPTKAPAPEEVAAPSEEKIAEEAAPVKEVAEAPTEEVTASPAETPVPAIEAAATTEEATVAETIAAPPTEEVTVKAEEVAPEVSEPAPAAEVPTEMPTLPAPAEESEAPQDLTEATPAIVETPTVEEKAEAEAPAPVEPKEAPKAAEEEEESEISGIDTLDIDEPKGNWLLKRIWWEKAERLYEKIKQQTAQILDARMVFFNARLGLDKEVFDPFYFSIGLDQGELEAITNYLIDQLEERRKERGSLDQQERVFLAKLQSEKQPLEKLKQDVENITAIDKALGEALQRLLEQINQAQKYEQEAWESLKAIARELSDKRAREIYYSMDTTFKNVQNIYAYVSGAFGQHFNKLVNDARSQVDTIKTAVQGLTEKGIDLKKQMQEEIERAQGKQPVVEVEEEEEDLYEEPSSGFFGSIWQGISWIGDKVVGIVYVIGHGIRSAIESIIGLFTSSEVEAEQDNDTTQEETSPEMTETMEETIETPEKTEAETIDIDMPHKTAYIPDSPTVAPFNIY